MEKIESAKENGGVVDKIDNLLNSNDNSGELDSLINNETWN